MAPEPGTGADDAPPGAPDPGRDGAPNVRSSQSSLPWPAVAPRPERGRAVSPAAADGVDYDALFRRLYPSLFRYLHRMTGDADAADDIAQESFVRLLGRAMPEDEARLWLFTVATNLFRDGARTSKRRERLLAVRPWAPAALPRPDETLERTLTIGRVRQALDQLSERDRQMLIMREEGFRYDEIAQVAGVAPGSVGTLLARAARRFVAVYDAQEGEGEQALG
jgi:RNA polymerase sigma-70 factor, ECF subfamily